LWRTHAFLTAPDTTSQVLTENADVHAVLFCVLGEVPAATTIGEVDQRCQIGGGPRLLFCQARSATDAGLRQ
jgi:hypothetical protein